MKQVEFRLPEGFEIPEGVEAGQEFESMATFEVKKGGRLCLKAIGETAMPGYGEPDQQSAPDPGKEIGRKYREALGDQ